jgi:hypothetical protein
MAPPGSCHARTIGKIRNALMTELLQLHDNARPRTPAGNAAKTKRSAPTWTLTALF